jgi:hypothetical protein
MMPIPEYDRVCSKSNTLIKRNEIPTIRKKELFINFREFQPIKKIPPEITILITSAIE